jgi:hypothetical protein
MSCGVRKVVATKTPPGFKMRLISETCTEELCEVTTGKDNMATQCQSYVCHEMTKSEKTRSTCMSIVTLQEIHKREVNGTCESVLTPAAGEGQQ